MYKIKLSLNAWTGLVQIMGDVQPSDIAENRNKRRFIEVFEDIASDYLDTLKDMDFELALMNKGIDALDRIIDEASYREFLLKRRENEKKAKGLAKKLVEVEFKDGNVFIKGKDLFDKKATKKINPKLSDVYDEVDIAFNEAIGNKANETKPTEEVKETEVI
jgi:predicted RNA-binding protein with EMAP domain